MNRLPTGCEPLDKLLKGGIECGAITQFYGEPGSGKTNVCLQLACSCVKNGLRVAYVDSEGVSMERLEQIGGPSFNYADILFSKPYSLEEQEKLVRNAVRLQGLGLIIVDTINMYMRLRYHESPDDYIVPVLRQLEMLSIAAQKNDYPVVITSQVYQSKDDGEIKAFGGLHMAYTSKTIVRFDRISPGRRRATIIKHRSLHESASAEFKITANGLE
jgi:DNA repair protein RadB